MAEVIWTDPAMADLDAIADHIALDKPGAAALLVKSIFAKVAKLSEFPDMGGFIPEMRPVRSHRQLLVAPCRIFYRHEAESGKVWVLAMARRERLFKAGWLRR